MLLRLLVSYAAVTPSSLFGVVYGMLGGLLQFHCLRLMRPLKKYYLL